MHIYDFISDPVQYWLKEQARNMTKGEPFENSLHVYFELFRQHFDKIDMSTPSKHLTPVLAADGEVNKWFEMYAGYILADKPKVISLLNEIGDIYELFLKGKQHAAVTMFALLLEKYDLLDDSSELQLGSTFRIRALESGRDHLQDDYYYHIPHHLRWLIKNQRFSVTGIPLHYAGFSLVAPFLELGAVDLDDKSFGVSMFAYDPFANMKVREDWQFVRQRKRVYDISNSLFEIVNDLFFDLIEQGKTVAKMHFTFTRVEIIRQFRKFIVSSICTFPRKFPNQPFAEEYIIPQLLTEAIRTHKYDGIIYPSTKFLNIKVESGKGWTSNFYRNNIVLFTQYEVGRPHDYDLYKNFEPDVQTLTDLKKYDAFNEIAELDKAVVERIVFLDSEVCESELKYRLLALFKNFKKRTRLYPALKVNDKLYLSTFAGKAEVKYLVKYMQFISGYLGRVYGEDIKVWREKREKQQN